MKKGGSSDRSRTSHLSDHQASRCSTPAIQRVRVFSRASEVCGPEGRVRGGPWRSRRRRQFGADRLDVGAGVADGFSGVHGGSGGDAAVEGVGVESVADVNVGENVGEGVVGGGAVEGGGDMGPVDPVEERGQVGERACQVG